MSGKRLPPGQLNRPDRQARLDAYAGARDGGMNTWQAADYVGIAVNTRRAYERWYRKVRGLPAREGRVPPS